MPSFTVTNHRPRLVVVGSVNIDFVVSAAQLPRVGETVIGSGFTQHAGGKGANQAVAAARLGADVALVGRVGNDAFGREMLQRLRNERVNIEHLLVSEGTGTGLAAIHVASNGENSIVIVPGANGLVSPADVLAAADTIRAADMLLLQLEIPLDAVRAAQSVARESGVPVLLDPAPAPRGFPDDLLAVDFLCPNESEAEILAGFPVVTLEDARRAARRLRDRGVRHVMITLGARGVWVCSDGDLDQLVDSFPIDAVDATAAGDAFAGAFAVKRAEGGGLLESVRFGCAAGALAASRCGAQPSLPTRAEVERFMHGADHDASRLER